MDYEENSLGVDTKEKSDLENKGSSSGKDVVTGTLNSTSDTNPNLGIDSNPNLSPQYAPTSPPQYGEPAHNSSAYITHEPPFNNLSPFIPLNSDDGVGNDEIRLNKRVHRHDRRAYDGNTHDIKNNRVYRSRRSSRSRSFRRADRSMSPFTSTRNHRRDRSLSRGLAHAHGHVRGRSRSRSRSRSFKRSRSRGLYRNKYRQKDGIAPEPDKCKIFIGNLSDEVEEYDLERLFKVYGTPVDVFVPKDMPLPGVQSGKNRGFGFVSFKYESEAKNAKENMNGHQYRGRVLRVELAKPKRSNKYRDRGRETNDFRSHRNSAYGGNRNSAYGGNRSVRYYDDQRVHDSIRK